MLVTMVCLSHCLLSLPSVWGDPSQELRPHLNFIIHPASLSIFSGDDPYYLHEVGANEVCSSQSVMEDTARFPLARIEMSPGCLYLGITDHWA